MPFSRFGLHPQVERGVGELGFQQATPIQLQAIPPALAGRDVLACAPTGTGKTAAFVLPILHRLMDSPGGTTRALILTPTRELAAQVEGQVGVFGRHTRITSATIYGGVGMGPQERAFRRGVDVIVATPGRLLDHLSRPYARLDRVEILVLDEADRMLDMGFLPDVHRILRRIPTVRQTMLFSATVPPAIATFAQQMLRDPVRVDLAEGGRAPAVGIAHSAYPVPAALKPALLLELLVRGDLRSVIAFTRTKHRANRLADYLGKNGVAATRIHGNRSQAQRTQALGGFKAGKFNVLVATDLAARGIDVDDLSHVVNFDVPGSAEDYVHRAGRTARAEAKGDAFVFVSAEEEGDLRGIERAIGCRFPRITLPGFDYAHRPAEKIDARMPAPRRPAAPRGVRTFARGRRPTGRHDGGPPSRRA